jgi:hypothetical protein
MRSNFPLVLTLYLAKVALAREMVWQYRA